MMQCQVPIKRLGNGYYLFGTRKIFAKIMHFKSSQKTFSSYFFKNKSKQRTLHFVKTLKDVSLPPDLKLCYQ
jgi:hypothetical protein